MPFASLNQRLTPSLNRCRPLFSQLLATFNFEDGRPKFHLFPFCFPLLFTYIPFTPHIPDFTKVTPIFCWLLFWAKFLGCYNLTIRLLNYLIKVFMNYFIKLFNSYFNKIFNNYFIKILIIILFNLFNLLMKIF